MTVERRVTGDPMMAAIRRNLSIIIATFSLVATVTFGYASYKLLEYRVAELELISSNRAANNLQIIKETRGLLDSHLRAYEDHMGKRNWDLLMDRLASIERKLDAIK